MQEPNVAVSIGAVGYMPQHSRAYCPAVIQASDLAWSFPSHQYNQNPPKEIKAAEQKVDWRARTQLDVTHEWVRMEAESLTGFRTQKY